MLSGRRCLEVVRVAGTAGVTVKNDTASKGRSRYAVVFKGMAIGVSIAASLAVVAVVGERSLSDAAPAVFSAEGKAVVWEENFEGPAGGVPDPAIFDYDVGGGGWGNDEKQMYTRDVDNARVDGNGNLIVEARRAGDGYTSARLVTRGKVNFGLGLLEARIKMPQGSGIHPAFWLLGKDVLTEGYPQAGEVDIIEVVDSGALYHNAVHGPLEADPATQWKQGHDGDANTNLSDDFHVYQLLREDGVIKIGIDGRQVGEYRRSTMPEGARWVFDAPMYINLNVAVGGEWPGPVDASTQFPATMLVDWIRYSE